MLEFVKIRLKSAEVGEDSFIPDITSVDSIPFFRCDDSVEPEEAVKIGTGVIASIMPYKMQNNYSREFSDKEYIAAILEDENYKAVFLPELGGRLWSLYDKKNAKDLVYVNDSVKFANLALCNAWFAGGVEWNIGIKGHSPYTARPMFATKVRAKDGADILRMYQFEEIHSLAYCVEARLTKDGLAVHMTVDNVKDEPTLMYWWSNIAVVQTKETRIYVPTSKTFVTNYRDGGYLVTKIDVPINNGVDISTPSHALGTTDYFYDIPKENPKWICSVEGDGYGLLHYTADIMKGRKAFLWGQRNGGKHWNEWLTEGRDYLEIQAGLCKTQFEHFEIEPHAHIEWTELYSPVSLKTEGYDERVAEINAGLPDISEIDRLFDADSADVPTVLGCGRGYLEQQLTGKNFGEKYNFCAESVSEEQKYYLQLLGLCDDSDILTNQNTEFVYNKNWIDLILKKENVTAFDNYIVALIYYEHREMDKSKEFFEKSLAQEKNWYVMAAYAKLLSSIFNVHKEAYVLIKQAMELEKDNRLLYILAGEIAIRAEEYGDYADMYENACGKIKSVGRLQMYTGQCYVMMNELDRAKQYINEKFVMPDIREGEYAVSNIWIMLYRKALAKLKNIDEADISDEEVLEAYPLPKDIDFRLH